MEDQILIDSVRPWSSLYLVFTPPPPYVELEYPHKTMREGTLLFFTKRRHTVFLNRRFLAS